ncbi:hypothetical protein [Rufibacter latericius]|nr:hypothetical protein [Rufibacter latericius]
MKILTSAKQYRIYFLFFYFLAVFLCSCTSPVSDFDFDSKTWKNDLNGCKGDRVNLREQIESIRLKLGGLHESDIRKLLGKPDAQQLLENSQEIYIYYITSGPKCTSAASQQSKEKEALTVRMDALGNVREANIFKE